MSSKLHHAPLALSMGDPAGIGPEIIIKAWLDDPETMGHCCVAGDLAVMQRAASICQQQLPASMAAYIPQPVAAATWQSGHSLGGNRLPVLQACEPVQTLPALGQVQRAAGQMAAACIEVGARAVLQGACAALVTAPIHKEALHAAGVPYPGHTEMLQALAAQHQGVAVQSLPVRMMLANTELKTVLNSIHVSLRDAIEAVTFDNVLQTIQITHAFLMQQEAVRAAGRAPIIAVAGLNPHAGEAGQFGREEIDIIQPAIAAARQQGMNVRGPFPPDTVFMTARENAQHQPPFCDAVIAMYHDQGLIPVKYLGLQHGVNVTLGLPLLRTSPDHGTAFDLAGTARADSSSLLEATRMALRMSAGV
ncbi:MAG: 4-hydroxythreonine-4-phosphate dehydrogenase PdxA [Brachymonas sp.]|nr:4-hydroxythreonine-4-phosphate dehydrogenase PdxA [Brachymonas sp.]